MLKKKFNCRYRAHFFPLCRHFLRLSRAKVLKLALVILLMIFLISYSDQFFPSRIFFSLLNKRKKMRVCTIKASLCFPLFIFSSILNLFLTCFCFIRNCFRGSNAPSPSLTLTWWDQILLLPLDINLEEIQHCSRLTCFRKKKNTLISTILSSL